MATIKLRPPEWQEAPEFCVGCGYALRGLESPGVCPECGTAFDRHTMTLVGIPRRGSATSPARRVAWGLVLAAGVVWVQCLGFAFLEPTAFLAVGAAWLAGLIALFLTGKRERSPTQPIIFTAGGFGLASDEQTDAGSTLIPWDQVSGFELKRVGAAWYRLRLGRAAAPNPEGVAGRVVSARFDAGVQIRAEDEARVRATLEHHLAQNRVAGG